MRTIPKVALAAAVCILTGPFGAASEAAQGWGPRIGVADDPDQVILGLQSNVGDVAQNLFVQPDAEIGLGSHATVLTLSLPLHYRFRTNTAIGPYAGGGVSAGIVKPKDHDANFEMALKLVGGLQWNLNGGRRFFTELAVGLGDLHDVSVVGGWMLW